VGAWIRNDSDLPILDVRTSFHFIQENQPGGNWEPVFRGSTIEQIRVMPPRRDRFIAIPAETRSMLKQCNDSVYVVSITFTDAAGNKWERDPRGALVPRS
jgi:glutamine synthetase